MNKGSGKGSKEPRPHGRGIQMQSSVIKLDENEDRHRWGLSPFQAAVSLTSRKVVGVRQFRGSTPMDGGSSMKAAPKKKSPSVSSSAKRHKKFLKRSCPRQLAGRSQGTRSRNDPSAFRKVLATFNSPTSHTRAGHDLIHLDAPASSVGTDPSAQ